MIKYNQSFNIPYYEGDKYGKIRPISLLKYLGEVSMVHNSLLVDHEEMEKSNQGWMLNRWKVRIDRYPNAGENIKVETWISEIDKFYAYREFMIYDEENIQVAKASAVWIFLDMKRKRPIRIKSEHYNLSNILEKKVFDDFHKFEINMDVENIIDFHIRRSDIDYNNHVNNTKYLEWMVEAIPEDIYDKYILNEFEIQYKSEVKYPDTILSGIQEKNKIGEEVKYFHIIVDKESNDEKSLGMSKWKVKQ